MWEMIAGICRKVVLLSWAWFVVSIIFVPLASTQSGYNTQAEGATIPQCQERHVFLIANSTDGSGTCVTYVNSQTGESNVTEFKGRYLPSSEVCGDNYKRCNTSLTTVSENVTLMMFPLDDGIGLVSFVSDSIGSMVKEQTYHLMRSTAEECVFVYFVQFSTGNFIGYCLNLSGLGVVYTFSIIIDYHSLEHSIIQPRSAHIITRLTYNLGLPSTNFILFENDPANCFSANPPHILFLRGNILVDHVYEESDYIELGLFNSALCTRIERIGECALAFYCEGVIYIVTDIENFHFIPISSGDVPGHVFPCSSDKYVRLINQTLTLHEVASQSVFSNAVSFPHHFETILRGSCQIVGTGFYFIVTLTDGQTFVVNFTDSAYNFLGEDGLPGGAVSSIIDGDIAVITNGTSTLIKNWTLTCNNDPLIVQSGFTFANVHSSTSNLATQCRCPVAGTDMTHATTGTTSSSGLTTSRNTSESSVQIILMSIFLPIVLLVIIGIIFILLLRVCIYYTQKRKQSELVSVQESTDQRGGGHIPRSNDHEGVTMPKAGDDGSQSKEEEASAELNQVVESSMNIDGEVGIEMKRTIPSERCDTQQGRLSENVNKQGQPLVNTNEQEQPPMEGQQQSNTTYLNGDGNATYKSGLPTLDSIADYDTPRIGDNRANVNAGYEHNTTTQLAFATNPPADVPRQPALATNGQCATPVTDDIPNDAAPIPATTTTGHTSSRLVLPDHPSIPSDLMTSHNSEQNFPIKNQTSDVHLPNTEPVSATPTNDNTDSVLVGPDSMMSQMPKLDSIGIERVRERRERRS